MRNLSIPIATNDPRSPRAALSLPPTDLLRSIYVVGKTGTGKSTLMEHVALGAVDAGIGVCVVDLHGDLVRHVLEQLPSRHWNRVVVLDPNDSKAVVGLNLLSPESNMAVAVVASGIVEIFRKLWGATLFGPRSEHLLRNALLTLLAAPGATLVGLLRVLTDESYRNRLLVRVSDPVVRNFWLREFPLFSKQFLGEVMAPILNKLGALTAPAVRRVVGQVAPRLRLREAMDAGRVIVCDLSGLGRDAGELLGAIIVTGIGLAAMSRSDIRPSARRPFLLVADEFHAYVPAGFAQFLAEARKFGLCCVLAHQHLAQLDHGLHAAIMGNVGTIASFCLSSEDAKLMAPEFEPYVTSDDLSHLRRYRLALRLFHEGEPVRPTLCHALPPLARNGGPPEALLRISRERYGRAVDTVDREIGEGLGMFLQQKEEPASD